MTLYSIVDARGTGGAITLAPPPYLRKEHIYVYVDGLPTTAYEWISDSAIRLTAPINRLVRIVRRTSPDTLLTDYKDGTQLPGVSLSVDSKQAFYMAQEALDLAMLAGGTAGGSVPPGIELTQQGIKDLLAGQITPSELELSLRKEIERISGTEEVIGSVAWKVLQEAIARTAAIQSEAQARAAALLHEAQERGAAITVETQARQSAVASLAQQITTLTASTNAALAAVQTEVQARVDADGALATQVSTVATAAANAAAAVVTETTARSNADNAIASSVEAIRVALEDADTTIKASVTTETTARVNADNALAGRVTSLETAVGGSGGQSLSSRITSVEQAVSTETSARATAVSNLETAYKDADTTIKASVTAANQARADADTALANRASVLEAKVDPGNIPAGKTVLSLIADEATTRSNADSTNAQAIQSVQSSITGAGGISPRLAAVETKADTSATELGTVKANYTIKVQARSDGKQVMAGIGLNATIPANGPAQSELVFLADKMTFVPDMNGLNVTPQPLFVAGVVDGANTFVLPRQRLGDGLIEARMIVDGGIEARHMKITGSTGANLVPDPKFQDATAWRVAPWGNGYATDTGFRFYAPGGTRSVRLAKRFPVTPGKRYKVSVDVYKTPDCNGSLYLRVERGPDPTYATYSEDYLGVENVYPPASTWTTYSGEWVANSDYASPMVLINYSGNAGVMWASNVRFEQMIDSSLVVQGGISADRIDTRGLVVKDQNGNVLLGSGAPLNLNYVPSAALNSNISISATGALQGAGGGQVTTIPVRDDSAERGTNRPPSWYPVGTTREFKVSAAVGLGGADNYLTLETVIQYSDSSGGACYQYAYRGTTTWRRWGTCGASSWAGAWVQDLDRSAYTGDLNATYGATIGGTLQGSYTQASWDTYMTSAFIRSAHIQSVSANQITVTNGLSDISGNVGLLRTASSGGRQEIEANRTRVFDGNNALRVVIGYLL